MPIFNEVKTCGLVIDEILKQRNLPWWASIHLCLCRRNLKVNDVTRTTLHFIVDTADVLTGDS